MAIPYELDAKIIYKMHPNQVEHIRNIHQDQVRVIPDKQGYFIIHNKHDVSYNKLKNKKIDYYLNTRREII